MRCRVVNLSQEAMPEILPHVYTSTPMAQGNVLSQHGSKYMLPLGTVREMNEVGNCPIHSHIYKFNVHIVQEYEEVIIPPARPVPPRVTEQLVPISKLDDLAKGSFPVRILNASI